jgi:hypothetical protein
VLLRIELLELSRARMYDAQLLFRKGRYDAAAYLCGYAVEFALKARICKHLRWVGYPSTDAEFKGKRDFKVHNFNSLLEFTGLASKIRNNCSSEWSIVTDWSPELRYRPIGSSTYQHAQEILEASKVLLKKLH